MVLGGLGQGVVGGIEIRVRAFAKLV